jgi:diguanylate cyclase (GGDEF)-like protein
MAGFAIIPKHDARQATRLKRYFFAVLSSLLVLIFMAVVHIYGYMELRGLTLAALGMAVLFVVFYVLLRSGLNLQFRDPSLTAAQMMSAIVVIIMAAYYTQSEARSTFLPVLLMIFYFGIYRFDHSQMTSVALFTIACYGMMVWLLYEFRPHTLDLRLEPLRLWILSVVLLWFAQLGGHVQQLRRELTLRKEAIEALLERDDLTGAGNRRFLTHMLEQEKSRADRTGATFCLGMLDLDFFKKVNDSYGHQAGDTVLKVFTQVAQQELRRIDYFGRFGGEEFLLIMAETNMDGAQVKAERLRANVDKNLVQTVSIGLAEYRPGESIENLLQRADRAMYRAKSNGRNRVEIDAPYEVPRHISSSIK